MRDSDDKDNGLIVFSPRWVDDTEPVNRPFCVVEKKRHKTIFDKLMAGVTRMSLPHASRLSLLDVAKSYRIPAPNAKAIKRGPTKRAEPDSLRRRGSGATR